MGCLGLHFSLDGEQVSALKAVAEPERVNFVQEEFEEGLWSTDPSRVQETDKAWDAIHRSLTDGSAAWDNGKYPLNRVVLGGELLYRGRDYILSLKTPAEVRDVATALRGVTKERLRAGYDEIDSAAYGVQLSEEDFEYTWEWFGALVEFYQIAAAEGRWVLFTADQ